MTEFSTLRSRRFAARQTEATQQIIAFCLAQTWFALPILAIQKVVPLGEIKSDPANKKAKFTIYQDSQLPIIDVAESILGYLSSANNNSDEKSAQPTGERYLIIFGEGDYASAYPSDRGSFGLPIDSQPILYRVSQSNFQPIPETYGAKKGIEAISSQVVELPNQSLALCLNPAKLSQNFPLKTQNV